MSARGAAARLLCLAFLMGSAGAQVAPRAASVEVGFRGEVVADAWNPLRLTLRDVDAGTFRLALDVGTLLRGEIPWVIEVAFAGGAGVSVVDTDVYLPPWRSATWTVEAGGATVASGAWPRDRADPRPVTLVVGATDVAAAGRRVDVDADSLPARAAAYDGVAAVIVANGATPSAEALAAAAVAGARVALVDDALQRAAARVLLGERDRVALGAGGVTRGWVDDDPWPRSARQAALDAFLAGSVPTPPPSAPWLRVMSVVGAYLAACWLSIRVGGMPGAATAAVAFVATLTFAQLPIDAGGARLNDASRERTRTLSLPGGGLAWEVVVSESFQLAPGAIERSGLLRPVPLRSASFIVDDRTRTHLSVGRAEAVVLVGAPRVAAERP